MRDDESGDAGRSYHDRIDGGHSLGHAEKLFGEFSVLSPGVQIVLDGRPVSSAGH